MSEINHTPGPWSYQEISDAYTHIVRDASGRGIIVYAPQSSSPVSEANARLCAAAPDLLAALNVAIKALTRLAETPGCGCSFPCRCNGAEWTQIELEGRMDVAMEALKDIEARAAIAKATGAA